MSVRGSRHRLPHEEIARKLREGGGEWQQVCIRPSRSSAAGTARLINTAGSAWYLPRNHYEAEFRWVDCESTVWGRYVGESSQ